MGDRVVIVFHTPVRGTDYHTGKVTYAHDLSPTFYMHWSGINAVGILQKAIKQKVLYKDLVSNAIANLVGFCGKEGVPGMALWNTEKTFEEIQEDSFSHGDAGVILIDSKTLIASFHNGYLAKDYPRPLDLISGKMIDID